MEWRFIYDSKLVSLEKAASKIEVGDKIWLTPAASTPVNLVNAICARKNELEDVHLYSCLIMYPFEYFKSDYIGCITAHSYFIGPVERKNLKSGNLFAGSIPLSRLNKYVEDVQPNVLIAEVSTPDKDGNMCYGPVGIATADIAIKTASKIIVQVNKNVPFIYGEKNVINVADVDYICEGDHLIPELPQAPITEVDKKIAAHIVPMIEDGSTIQIGFGGTSNAVGFGLECKKDLGVHSEMLTDSMVFLYKKGVINNTQKNYNPGKMIVAFGMGNSELYKFMDKNEVVYMKPFHETNKIDEIAKNDNFISINSALMTDLTGQVGSESIGQNQFSGTGGQLDFVRGAAQSKGGKSFLTIHSTVETKNGLESRIKLTLPEGTAITTPRSDTMYIATEYGVANLYNKNIPERVKELIKIAHPDFRENLTKQAIEAGLIIK